MNNPWPMVAPGWMSTAVQARTTVDTNRAARRWPPVQSRWASR